MIINGIPRIKDDGGDYLILTDYGGEGLAVTSQWGSLEEAISSIAFNESGSWQSLVKLVRIDTKEVVDNATPLP